MTTANENRDLPAPVKTAAKRVRKTATSAVKIKSLTVADTASSNSKPISNDLLGRSVKFIGVGFAWGFFWLGSAALFAYSNKSNDLYNNSSSRKTQSAEIKPEQEGTFNVPNIPTTLAAPSKELFPAGVNQADTSNAKVDKPYIFFGKKDVSANNNKTLIVFADPACPYCKKVDVDLKKLAKEGYEINLYPINALGRSAANIESLLCNERESYSSLWSKLMNNSEINQITCQAGRDAEKANLALHSSLGFKSVPIIIAKSNGNYHVGDASAEELKQLFTTGYKQKAN